jgi:hypothetical protein
MMNDGAAMKASDIKVGDVVEFEPGAMVRVTEIDESEAGTTPALLLAELGPRLSFAAVYADEYEGTPLEVLTSYTRRAEVTNITRRGG